MSAIDVGRDSIQRRIVREFFATTGLVPLLTAGALFSTAFFHFQTVTNENLIAIARVIGGSAEASLLFDDEQTALDTLRALKAEERIEAAIVFDSDGLIFAKYVRSDVADFRPPREIFYEPIWSHGHIDLASEIMMGDEKVGVVFIRADTNEVTRFLFISIGIVLSVLLISLFLCWFGAARLQNHIAVPLERLVEGSASMAEGDLSTQVEAQSDDELGVLARAFNAMVLSLRGLVAQVGENTRYVAEATE
jgi:methyl-accepting chemotaxis protein